MHPLDLKIPPPVVALIIALAMWAVALAAPLPQAAAALRVTVALACGAVGAAFDLSALLAFRRARTTINPMKPASTSSFVRSGVYRITRNPMYVGLVWFLLAWAAYLWSPWALPGPLLFMGYVGRFQIGPEERVLAEKFGDPYRTYLTQVRRWL
jgi:protein-S-isoprenylcysteine O-methyltransferase Ste14